MEAVLIPFIVIALLVHFWGTKKNTRKARKWMAVHAPILDSEFALVGFHRQPKLSPPDKEGVQDQGLMKASAKLTGDILPDDLLKGKTAYEFETYASGRQNVAFADFKITLKKRYNPIILGAETVLGMFFDTMKPTAEKMEAIMYTFDGKEKDYVPPPVPGAERKTVNNSSYDPFVFAIVNKMSMRKLRDDRYDVSLTFTKDNAKLPAWATVMSESAEITDTMLTKDIIAAVNAAGEAMEYLVISDMPVDKPTTLDEMQQKKRMSLSLRLPSDGNYLSTLPIFQAFLRLPDHLASQAHFRPEVMRKVNAIRDQEKGKLKKISDKEAEEERLKMTDKLKKDERDRKMKGMSAEEQRKFLEKESERNRKKQEKRMTRKG